MGMCMGRGGGEEACGEGLGGGGPGERVVVIHSLHNKAVLRRFDPACMFIMIVSVSSLRVLHPGAAPPPNPVVQEAVLRHARSGVGFQVQYRQPGELVSRLKSEWPLTY